MKSFSERTLPDLIGSTGLFTDGDWIESKDQDPNGDVRLIQLADIGDGEFLDKSARFLTSDKATELKCTFLEPGDILLARMPDPLGRACIFPGNPRPCVVAVDICIIRLARGNIDKNWLVRQINSPEFRFKISRFATGTTRKRISRSNLAKIRFSVPPLEEQRRIAAILDTADTLRTKRRQAIAKLDTLLQSTFLTMFGDPVTNPMGWEVRPLGEVCRQITDGVHKTPTYVASGIPFISTVHVSDEGIDWQSSKFITQEEHEELTKRCHPRRGDVLYTKVGSVGFALPILDDREFSIFVQLALLKPSSDRIGQRFLVSQLNTESIKHRTLSRLTGATMKYIGIGDIGRIDVIVPPVSLQHEYEIVVMQVESERQKLVHSQETINGLFYSLQQRAFKGNL